MMNHKGERNWKCSICSKGFLIEWDLELHMRTHTNIRPYICEICGKIYPSYTDKFNFKVYTFTNENIF